MKNNSFSNKKSQIPEYTNSTEEIDKAIKNPNKKIPYIEFNGSNYFRLKIAYSFLLNKPIRISEIRSESINPGLTKYEISFLKLISLISNGTEIKINQTGTSFTLNPGTITNNYGDNIRFDCDNSRNITYYAEGLIPICLFGKESLHINLTGITNNIIDNSVDSFKMSTCILLQKLIIGDNVEFKVLKRGVLPNGIGEIYFKIPIITYISPFDWIDEGKINKIRGIAFTSKLSSVYTRQMIDSSRGILNKFLPDVWISEDIYKDKDLSKISPGYGLTLCAETKNGFCFCTDMINDNNNIDKTANDLSKECTLQFLNDIYSSGCCNVNNQSLFLFLMCLSEKNYVSKMKVGKITEFTKGVLKFIDKYIGVKFHIRECDDYDKEDSESSEDNNNNNEENEKEESEEEEKENEDYEEPITHKQYMFSCVGIGLKNVARIELQ